ncbi:MAG: endolytic transglycosylase MltG [Rhodococcus sp. (in: high G+C Gram-positive bacteria)]|uniref:endolytic transglycosylase MltG n=1 Tax=Rhodococcus sp. TaxID=1831 RepID=UPI003BB1D5DD
MSNHRRASGDEADFDFVDREPRRHRYLEDDETFDHAPPGGVDEPYPSGGVDEPYPSGRDAYAQQSSGHHTYRGDDHEYEHEYDYDEASIDDAPPDGTYDPPYTRPNAAFEDAETQIIPALPREVPVARTRAEPRAVERHRRQSGGSGGRIRRKVVGALAAATVLVVLAGLVFVGGKLFFGGSDAPADYAGPGGPPVVVQVDSGDTAHEIASTLAERDVVASGSAFFNAAVQNPAMNSVQPGYYSLSTKLPAADAVRELIDPTSRVGQMIISEGRQLHDNTDVQTGAKKKGIYTLISEASCIGQAEARQCISYDDLDRAGAGDLNQLGVPGWAKDAVAGVPDRDRQLEGLIAAGSWDFDPTADPAEILRQLVTESAANYEETGILTAGNQVGLTPYKMLIAASLVEREAMPADFPKVARVILNRLAVDQALQFDSTVNYALDTTELATTDADRAEVTPWNTYASPGLPATPIASPSIAALEAVESPEPGDWIYFVTVDSGGTTLFTKNYDEHLTNIDKAMNNGILDSGR